MKHLLNACLFLLTSILFIGCADNVIIEPKEFTIEFGSECGWCGGQEFIIVTNSNIEYVRNIPCGEKMGTTNKSRNLTSEEWEEITNSFDYSLFKTLEYTNCNVCVDGCDEIIRITDDDFTHELKYSFSDEIEGMEILRQKLNEIMDETRGLD